MSHIEQQEFCHSVKMKFPSFFEYKFVLDVGCLDINGNNGAFFSGSHYLGLDVAQGRNVDFITPGHELGLPNATFDTIISTECFEHDQFYEKTIKNIYRMLKPGGLFVFTCATTGRPEHGTRRTTPEDAPLLQDFDGWSDYYKNLEEDDIKNIFDNFDSLFKEYHFSVNEKTKDLYFWGVKFGEYESRNDYSFLINPENNSKNISELKNDQKDIIALLKEHIEEKVKYDKNIFTLKNKLDELSSELNDLQAELLMMQNSNSYRLTKPIRATRRLLSKPFFSNKINRVVKLWDLVSENPKIVLRAATFVKKFGIKQTCKRLVSASNQQITIHSSEEVNIRNYDKVYILTTPHCVSIAKRIAENLNKIAINSSIIFEKPKEGYGDGLHFVICAQMFSELPRLYISYQLEQSVSSRWFDDRYFNILQNSFAIFDYSENNIDFLQKNNFSYKQLFMMPIGYDKNLRERINENYEYDVVFYGDINNKRRKEYLDELSKHFNVKIINNLFGEDLYTAIEKAKVVINIHYYENALLETTRIFECLSLNKLVITETSSDINQHENIKQCVEIVDEGDIEAMISRVSYWIEDANRLKDKVERNAAYLNKLSDMFEFYFMRFMLSHDWITFDEFYELAANNIHFESDFVCLGLPESTQRKIDFDKDNKYGIEYFPGLRHKLGWVGCGLSYKFILRKAKDQNIENITICEDDVEFFEDFVPRYQMVKDYLSSVENEGWDLFSGLIADFNANTEVNQVMFKYNEEFIYINKMTSMVLNIYSNRFYEKVISWDDSNHNANTNTIDRYIENGTVCNVITTAKYLVGHKADLDSTLWGFNNSTYTEMIETSNKKLNQKKDSFLKSKDKYNS